MNNIPEYIKIIHRDICKELLGKYVTIYQGRIISWNYEWVDAFNFAKRFRGEEYSIHYIGKEQ